MDGILSNLNLSDQECGMYKEKTNKIHKEESTRSPELLELKQIDICGSFKNRTICGNHYFVTFIDDYFKTISCFFIGYPDKSKGYNSIDLIIPPEL